MIGIYTEDEERRKRLRNQEHLVDDDIDAIDVIEQNSEFKREIKKYESLFAEGKGKYNGPYIIKELYNQFKENNINPVIYPAQTFNNRITSIFRN